MKKIPNLILFAGSLAALIALVNQAVAGPQTPSQSSQEITISSASSRPAQLGSSALFTGTVHVQPVFSSKAPGRTSSGLVTFEPGARSAWHTHPLGQALVVSEGTGWIGYPDGTVKLMQKGDVVQIPANVRHWHGATSSTTVTHYAIQEELEGKNVEWLEKVSDEQYRKGPSPVQKTQPSDQQPSAIKQQLGDFAPKMVQLTDDVLFGDIWKRTELAPRDRSLVTISALVAGGHPDQLTFHLKRARDNGLTQGEIVEAFTHLAFYCGWPKALDGINKAKEVFESSSTKGGE